MDFPVQSADLEVFLGICEQTSRLRKSTTPLVKQDSRLATNCLEAGHTKNSCLMLAKGHVNLSDSMKLITAFSL